jgi:hypothetical protein
METTEKNYIEKINSISKLEWSPLLNLIPIIERTQNFGELKGGGKLRESLFLMPCMSPSEVISQFVTLSYELQIIINFDWGSWDEGRKMASDGNFNYDSIDIPTKCKLITAIVRNDRFCEGVLVESFESGLILKLLKSIEKQIG